MSDLVLFLIFTVVIFTIFVFGRKFFGKDALFTMAIGSIIGANIYNIGAYPLDIFGLVFGFDSVIYTVFVFSVLIMYIDYGRDAMRALLYSAIASTLFTALLAFFGTYSVSGISEALIWSTFSYINSVIATFFAIWVMIYLYDYLRNKKRWKTFVCIILALALASIINSFIYFGLTFLFSGNIGGEFWLSLIGSYLGKALALGFSILVYYIGNSWVVYYRKTIEQEKINEKSNNDKF